MSDLIVLKNPKSTMAESYRSIRTNIQFANVDKEIKTILVTSAIAEEGKTTTLANLAVTMVQNNQKVLVVDCDMRKPRVHKTFEGLSNRKGLSNLLVDNDDYKQYIQQVNLSELTKKYDESAIKGRFKSNKKNQTATNLTESKDLIKHSEYVLDIITAGTIPDNPSELLNSKAMKQLIEQLKLQYDYILLDTSPVIPVTDAVVISNYIDGVILVVTAGLASVEVLKRAKDSLLMVDANLLGVVLNKVSIKSRKAYKSYYYYQAKKNEEE
ncbi:MAG: CpsD/CapB family tyrosine-protein kinase [Vallitaleaceae bacterium]|nr:CpsD/CapB family tyrosine-protein kinase [Vallitaleaceae bacterium]